MNNAFQQGFIGTDGGQLTAVDAVTLSGPRKIIRAALTSGEQTCRQIQRAIQFGTSAAEGLMQDLLETKIGIHGVQCRTPALWLAGKQQHPVTIALKSHEFSDTISDRFASFVQKQASLDKNRSQP